MAKTKISEFDTNPSNNTDIDGINIAEGCAPSGINNAIRELMSQLKEFQTGASGDNFKVGGTLEVDGAATFDGAVTFTSTVSGLGLGTISTQNANNVAITGGTITGITDLAVADGGTGVSTLAANSVILGNGTSAVQTVAPSTSGNILTSNGTTWVSAPAPTPFSWNVTYVNVTLNQGDSYNLPANCIMVQGYVYGAIHTNSRSGIDIMQNTTQLSRIEVLSTVGANNGNGYWAYFPFNVAVSSSATSIKFTSIGGASGTMYITGYVTKS